jgi:hypothetical protein
MVVGSPIEFFPCVSLSADAYICPICGQTGHRNGEGIHRELNICSCCGSNARFRATVLAFLQAIVDQESAYNLSQVQPDKTIRGIGCSDSDAYARTLVDKYDYVNTFYHREPYLDVESISSYLEYQPLNFILCNDILEHTALPPAEVVAILYQALQPGGHLILCAPTYRLANHIEKYPSFDSYEVKSTVKGYHVEFKPKLGEDFVDRNPCFHGGPGRVLEIRLISEENLRRNLVAVGFEITQVSDSLLKHYGAWWPERVERRDLPVDAVGKPFICRKPWGLTPG